MSRARFGAALGVDAGRRATRASEAVDCARPVVTPVVYGAGPRALEPLLLERIAHDQASVRDALTLAARPLRVVVSSRSLRQHLATAALRHVGRPLLGVRVQTLAALAREVLERAGLRADPDDLFPLLVRRAARQEPSLRDALDDLADGYAAVRGAVDDLFDAGFTAEHAEAIDELLAARGSAEHACERAVVRVAERVSREQAAQGVGHRACQLALAREALLRGPVHSLPARGVLVHGFNDATGVAADWLETLVRLSGAEVYMSRPGDPGRPQASAPERVFGAALRERLEAAAGRSDASPAPEPTPPQVAFWKLRDPSSEVRALAQRLREQLDHGVPAESLAVIARDLAPYRLPLRRHLRALAIPFSGVGEPGPVGVAGRQLSALLDLLREGESLPAERWLEATSRLSARDADRFPLTLEARADLLHALHRVGCTTLADVPSLAPGRAIALRVPRGLPADPAARGARSRELDASWVGALVAAACALLARLAAWPVAASWPEHASWLRGLVRSELGWQPELTPGADLLDELLPRAAGTLVLERAEFLDWLAHALEALRRGPLGGAGGGVQVLSVMEARGLCFEQVHLLGMNRGVFPRVVREDPLLSDAARRCLRDVLPDLPVKREGFDEERFLFADLLASSQALTLSQPAWNDAGQPLSPSPLLESLTLDRVVPRLDTGRVGLREQLLRAGLRVPREDFETALEVALGATAQEPAGAGLASARVRVLRELDPEGPLRAAAGPYLGFVGAARSASDPRRAALYVTQLENLSRCPWQTFLERQLGLAAPRDAHGPLPQGSDQKIIGNLVHQVLEKLGELAGIPASQSIEALVSASPRPLEWLADAELEALIERCAETQAQREGISIPGYARALARRARPYLDAARHGGAASVLGVESRGSVTLYDAQGHLRELHFRADRVDAQDGSLRITDYKTGSLVAKEKTLEGRTNTLRKAVESGKLLQASAYAFSNGASPLEGRYLYLAPDLDADARVLVAPTSDADRGLFEQAVRALLAGLDGGAFLPRLRKAAEDTEPRACTSCELKDACLRGDSGARVRLGAWAESTAAASPVEIAARALWSLDERRP